MQLVSSLLLMSPLHSDPNRTDFLPTTCKLFHVPAPKKYCSSETLQQSKLSDIWVHLGVKGLFLLRLLSCVAVKGIHGRENAASLWRTFIPKQFQGGGKCGDQFFFSAAQFWLFFSGHNKFMNISRANILYLHNTQGQRDNPV